MTTSTLTIECLASEIGCEPSVIKSLLKNKNLVFDQLTSAQITGIKAQLSKGLANPGTKTEGKANLALNGDIPLKDTFVSQSPDIVGDTIQESKNRRASETAKVMNSGTDAVSDVLEKARIKAQAKLDAKMEQLSESLSDQMLDFQLQEIEDAVGFFGQTLQNQTRKLQNQITGIYDGEFVD